MHLAALLVCHADTYSAPITIMHGIDKHENQAALRYRTHTSALKEAQFIHAELAEQVQAGHVAVFHLYMFMALPNLWISPIAVISQVGRRLHLIFDLTWSGINKATTRLAHMGAMRFRSALHRIL